MPQKYTFLADSIEETDTHIIIRKDDCVLKLIDLINQGKTKDIKTFFINMFCTLAVEHLQRNPLKKAA